MTKKDEPVHLNGQSKNFLADFAVLKEKLLNHLEDAANKDRKTDDIEKSVQELKTDAAVSKTKIEGMDVEIKFVIGILVSMFLLMVGAFVYIATNGVPTTP